MKSSSKQTSTMIFLIFCGCLKTLNLKIIPRLTSWAFWVLRTTNDRKHLKHAFIELWSTWFLTPSIKYFQPGILNNMNDIKSQEFQLFSAISSSGKDLPTAFYLFLFQYWWRRAVLYWIRHLLAHIQCRTLGLWQWAIYDSPTYELQVSCH